MRRIILGFGFFVLTALLVSYRVSAADMLDYIPKQSHFIMNIEFKKIIGSDFFQSMKKDSAELQDSYGDFSGKLKKLGMKPEELAESFVLFTMKDAEDHDLSGMVVKTPLSEADFVKLIKSDVLSPNDFYEEKQIEGMKVHVFKKVDDNPIPLQMPGMPALPQDAGKETVYGTTYLSKGIVMISELEEFPGVIKALKAGKISSSPAIVKQKAAFPVESVLWGIFAVKKEADAGAQPPMGGPMAFADNVQAGNFSLCMVGPKKADLDAKIALNCGTKQKASSSLMGLKITSMMFAGGAFQREPELGTAVTSAIKFDQQGEMVNISIKLPKTLQERLGTFFKDMGQQAGEDAAKANPRDDAIKLPTPPQAQ